MPIKKVFTKGNVPVKVWTDDIDHNTIQQLIDTASLPFIHKWVAVMPDVHLGRGSTIGSVIPTKNAIVPAAVGVDIGCGMMAVKLDLTTQQLPDSLKDVLSAIEKAVPLGAGGSHKMEKISGSHKLAERLESITKKHPALLKMQTPGRYARQIGTLGSGNHFIEICTDENQAIWVMLHSGSRGIGNCIGRYFIGKARDEMERYHIHLPNKDLSYFPDSTPLFDDYWEAVKWAQDYAMYNRQVMMKIVLGTLSKTLGLAIQYAGESAVNCHHNYVDIENHYGENVYVTRKGAIRAREGDLGIIPGDMGNKSFIVKGKGNKESFCSCSHGAGRRMSRTEAKKQFTTQDLRDQTVGVTCNIRKSAIDEIPKAYKPIEEVMENQTDLIEIVHTLKQFICVKG